MDEIITLSDDESEPYVKNSDNDNFDLSAILKKYEKYDFNKEPEVKKSRICNDVSPETSEDESGFSYAKIRAQVDSNLLKVNIARSPSPVASASRLSPTLSPVLQIEDDVETLTTKTKLKKPRNPSTEDKLLEKLKKEQEKQQKKEEKERLKAQLAEDKARKIALAAAYKTQKPEECLKYITAKIDSNLIQSEFGAEIPLILQTAEVKFRITSQNVPNVVTWVRDNQAQLVDVNGQLGISQEKDECEEIIYILPWQEFVEFIHNKNLSEHITTTQTIFPNKKFCLGVYGLQEYYRFHKNKKTNSKKDHKYAEAPKIRKKDVEFALIELQILMGISTRFLENPKDVGYMIAQFTKSIAQMPYKLQKAQKHQQMDWYVSGCNKDTVKVDKNGNGLMRLWRQQLTQFSLARLETAEAICSNYPSPKCLLQAYDECSSENEGKKLLQELPIRRAAGPLTSVRKLGPELSRKLYTMFNSTDGDIIV